MYRENVTPVNYVNRVFPLEGHSAATKELVLPECNNGVINHNPLPTVLVTWAAMLIVTYVVHCISLIMYAIPLLSY